MSEYVKQAKEFLANCNATMQMMYLGTEANDTWNEDRERDTYLANIRTPKGTMQVKFWDSINNTIDNLNRTRSNLPRRCPSAYDILACLQKYEVGDIEDFIAEYGYEITKKGDLKRVQSIYNAVVQEFNDVCRCFTEEQLEALREIW